MNLKNKFNITGLAIVALLTLMLVVVVAQATWSEPPLNGSNIGAPINTSNIGQIKLGALSLPSLLIMGNAANGFVGIGGDPSDANVAPKEKLDVKGNVRIEGIIKPDGSAGSDGQILSYKADAEGNPQLVWAENFAWLTLQNSLAGSGDNGDNGSSTPPTVPPPPGGGPGIPGHPGVPPPPNTGGGSCNGPVCGPQPPPDGGGGNCFIRPVTKGGEPFPPEDPGSLGYVCGGDCLDPSETCQPNGQKAGGGGDCSCKKKEGAYHYDNLDYVNKLASVSDLFNNAKASGFDDADCSAIPLPRACPDSWSEYSLICVSEPQLTWVRTCDKPFK